MSAHVNKKVMTLKKVNIFGNAYLFNNSHYINYLQSIHIYGNKIKGKVIKKNE